VKKLIHNNIIIIAIIIIVVAVIALYATSGVKMSTINRDIELIAKTIVGEGRGEPWEGKLAIANVILNRRAYKGWFGDSISKVVNKPSQFSCWNKKDPNNKVASNPEKYIENSVWEECRVAARLVYENRVGDNTNGATHYLNTYFYMRICKGYSEHWVFSLLPTISIGDHTFFREKE